MYASRCIVPQPRWQRCALDEHDSQWNYLSLVGPRLLVMEGTFSSTQVQVKRLTQVSANRGTERGLYPQNTPQNTPTSWCLDYSQVFN